ncbi:hypothetical protein ACIBH1_43265 [Nonomuraea sp. NPDC050663]|uniref:hypothetical protein n=1 Tax=Nonomuraea sp. NPDC050663 TaxID=3364370 RepID=UPI0037B2104E
MRRFVGLWAVAGTLAATALVVLLVVFLAGRPAIPDGLRQALSLRITQLLERASPSEHHQHGHRFGEGSMLVVCAVEPFGVEPADAADVSQVRWVYAHHLCAVDEFGVRWAEAIRASGPLAVELATSRVVVPESGAGYPDRVRDLIPARYHEAALDTFTDLEVIDEAQRRFDVSRSR